jgi:hypothetical protein
VQGVIAACAAGVATALPGVGTTSSPPCLAELAALLTEGGAASHCASRKAGAARDIALRAFSVLGVLLVAALEAPAVAASAAGAVAAALAADGGGGGGGDAAPPAPAVAASALALELAQIAADVAVSLAGARARGLAAWAHTPAAAQAGPADALLADVRARLSGNAAAGAAGAYNAAAGVLAVVRAAAAAGAPAAAGDGSSAAAAEELLLATLRASSTQLQPWPQLPAAPAHAVAAEAEAYSRFVAACVGCGYAVNGTGAQDARAAVADAGFGAPPPLAVLDAVASAPGALPLLAIYTRSVPCFGTPAAAAAYVSVARDAGADFAAVLCPSAASWLHVVSVEALRSFMPLLRAKVHRGSNRSDDEYLDETIVLKDAGSFIAAPGNLAGALADAAPAMLFRRLAGLPSPVDYARELRCGARVRAEKERAVVDEAGHLRIVQRSPLTVFHILLLGFVDAALSQPRLAPALPLAATLMLPAAAADTAAAAAAAAAADSATVAAAAEAAPHEKRAAEALRAALNAREDAEKALDVLLAKDMNGQFNKGWVRAFGGDIVEMSNLPWHRASAVVPAHERPPGMLDLTVLEHVLAAAAGRTSAELVATPQALLALLAPGVPRTKAARPARRRRRARAEPGVRAVRLWGRARRPPQQRLPHGVRRALRGLGPAVGARHGSQPALR